jgi:16S rRNA (guanine527-N7)-methyltransferase
VKQVEALRARAEAMGVDVAPDQAMALVDIVERMAEEPQNLSSPDALANAVDVHLADSLSGLLLPEVRNAAAIVDLGSGGGFPALVLAVMLPDTPVTMVESEQRKADWLARASAGMRNVRIVADRSESLARAERDTYAVATARALGALPVVMELAAPLLRPNGVLVAWRGRRDSVSEAGADVAGDMLGLVHRGDVDAAPIPGVSRYFSLWTKAFPTPDRYPRRPGMAAKRPLA